MIMSFLKNEKPTNNEKTVVVCVCVCCTLRDGLQHSVTSGSCRFLPSARMFSPQRDRDTTAHLVCSLVLVLNGQPTDQLVKLCYRALESSLIN